MIKILTSWRRHRLYNSHRNAEAVQEHVRRKIMRGMRGTAYAKDFGSSFERLPIVTYENIFPYIERMLAGEENILVRGAVKLFAKSSGTTNAKSKYIPTPRKFLKNNHYRAGKDMLVLYIASSGSAKFLAGKTLAVSGSLSASLPAGRQVPPIPDILCGDVSALLVKELPWWAKTRRAVDIETALLPNWEEKAEKIISQTASVDVRAITGTPTWVALILEGLLKKEKTEDIYKIWPRLEVFFHGAVAFAPYRATFARLCPQMKYMEIYNASEGYFAVQDDLDKPGEMLLLINRDIFYEFIPLKDLGKDEVKSLRLQEVRLGEQYALVISTTSGLYRYVIGDTVRFTSLNPYRIAITGRTKHFINAFGEEVVVENADRALARASFETGAEVAHYTAGPLYMDGDKAGAHEWFIEYKTAPNDQQAFNNALDASLRELNGDYDAKRTGDKIMHSPVVRPVPTGTFYEFMKRRGKLGGQHKIPPLANHREYLDEINTILSS